ncbi:unnamed protein product [Ectocarpus sp. 8 AP-2014]
MAHMGAPHAFTATGPGYSTEFLMEMFVLAATFNIEVGGTTGLTPKKQILITQTSWVDFRIPRRVALRAACIAIAGQTSCFTLLFSRI